MNIRNFDRKDISVYSFDLSESGMKKGENGAYLWELAPGTEKETITFPLDQIGVPIHSFDEIRILAGNLRGIVLFNVKINHFPSADEVRSWYSKTAVQEHELQDFRFDLKKNDDGWALNTAVQRVQSAKTEEEMPDQNPENTTPYMEISIGKIYRRVQGEPQDRLCQIEAIQLIRRSADLSFDEFKAELIDDPLFFRWRYYLEVLNRKTEPQTVKLKIETSRLKKFSVDWDEQTLELAPREFRKIPLDIFLPKTMAGELPALYSERVLPKLYCDDLPVVFPLIGYRPRYIWGTVPPEKNTFQLPVPSAAGEQETLLNEAGNLVEKPFCLPPQRHAEYCILFKPEEMEALSFYRFRDRHTGEDISQKSGVAGAYLYHHHEAAFRGMRKMAQAYLLTENPAFAEKIRDILLEYARNYRFMVPRDPASTSAGSRLTSTTLDLSYFFLSGVEAYAAVKNSGVFGSEDQRAIEEDFFSELMGNLYSHNILYSNMQLHHIRNYGGAALLLGRYLNLLGDALYGDHGFYAFADKGFTADGVALEAGVYHPFGFLPLLNFAARIRECGIEIISEKFRKIFDHGIISTAHGIAELDLRETYELGYRLFRNPQYLPTLKAIGKLPPEIIPDSVPDTLFLGNTLQKHNGYLFLRENSPFGFRALAINYLMQWDRLEHDRLHYRLFDEYGMVSYEVGRICYTSPGGDMEATISHNTVVIDEKYAMPNASELAVFLDRDSMPGALITEKKESRLYENSDFSKAVAIFDGIMFVGDLVHCKDGQSHKFDWPFYAPWNEFADSDIWNFRTEEDFQIPFDHKYPYVKEALSAKVPELFTACVAIPPADPVKGCIDEQSERVLRHDPCNTSFYFNIKGKPDRDLRISVALPYESTAAKFQIGRGWDPKPGPMLLIRQTGTKASFGAAFEVVKTGSTSRVKKVLSLPVFPDDPLSAVWQIECSDAVYQVVVNRSGKTSVYNKQTFPQGFSVIKL